MTKDTRIDIDSGLAGLDSQAWCAQLEDVAEDLGYYDFDDVLFYGADHGAYAATAYCVAAPGCRVLSLRPQATLDPRITGFDTRYRKFRRLDFNSRYGYAPEMIDAVDRAYIAYDPYRAVDAMHAALFTKRNMLPLRCNRLGEHIEIAFDALEIAEPVMRGAMDGSLDPRRFAQLMRRTSRVESRLGY